jgi:hypothetical protein
VHIKDKTAEALFDGGASISLAKTAFWKVLGKPKLQTTGVQSARCAGGTRLVLHGFFTIEAVICGVKNLLCLYVTDYLSNDIIIGSGSMYDFDLFRDPKTNIVMTRNQLLRTFQAQILATQKKLENKLTEEATMLGDESWNRTRGMKIYYPLGSSSEEENLKTQLGSSFKTGKLQNNIHEIKSSSSQSQSESVLKQTVQNGNFQILKNDQIGSRKNVQIANARHQVTADKTVLKKDTTTTAAQIINDNMCTKINEGKVINDVPPNSSPTVVDDQGWMFCKKRICLPAKSGRKVVLHQKGQSDLDPTKKILGYVVIENVNLMQDNAMIFLENGKCSIYLVNCGLSAVDFPVGTIMGQFHEIEEDSLCAIENCETEAGLQETCQKCHLTGLCDKKCKNCKNMGQCRQFQFSQLGKCEDSCKKRGKTGTCKRFCVTCGKCKNAAKNTRAGAHVSGVETARKMTAAEEQYIRKHARLDHLTQELRDKTLNLLFENWTVFSYGEFDYGDCKTIEHTLRFRHNSPIWTPQFPIALNQFEEMKRQVAQWFEAGIIERSDSQFNSPIFLVEKKGLTEDGKKKFRLVTDFRKINQSCFPETFRLPLISECLNEVARQTPNYFSALDLRAGYMNISMAEESKKATSFMLPGCGPGTGKFHYKRAPFGLKNLPFVFQKLVQMVFEGLPVITYLDDILCMSKTFDGPQEGMLQLLQKCFDRLKKHKLKINLEKSDWMQKKLTFLGHEISGTSYRMSMDKMEVIKLAPPPKTVQEVRAWNGLLNFFRQSIPNYAQISKPLTRLTRLDSTWRKGRPLPDDALKAFESQKAFMLKRPVLAYPVEGVPYELYVDGSLGDATNMNEGGIGAVLVQDYHGTKKVISCFSRGLVKHEKNYNAFLVEQLAMTEAIQHYRIYLLGRKFTVFTDHRPLVSLAKNQLRTYNRLQMLQSEFNFDTGYIEGKMNPSDWLSRNSNLIKVGNDMKSESGYKSREVIASVIDFNPLSGMKDGSMKICQEDDPMINLLKRYLDTGEKPKNAMTARLFRQIAGQCKYFNGVLKRELKRKGFVDTWCTILPAVFHADVLMAVHGNKGFSGHDGETKTINRLLQHYWWPGVANDVVTFVKSCDQCQRCDKSQDKKNSAMTPLPATTGPFQRIHCDLHGPIKTSLESAVSRSDGATNKKKTAKNYILIITDAFSKWTELVAIEDKQAETVTEAIWSRQLMRYGCPDQIITDQGKEFVSKITKELFERMEIAKDQTSAYRPQSDGQAEIINKHIRKYLATATGDGRCPDDWPEYIPAMQLALNTSISSATKLSPFYVVYGVHPRMPWLDQSRPETVNYGENYATTMINRVKFARKLAAENNLEYRDKYKTYHDEKGLKVHDFKPGDWVLFKRETLVKDKYSSWFFGPYVILGCDENNKMMLIQCTKSKKTHYANVAKLKKWNRREGDWCRSERPEKPSAVLHKERRPELQAEKQGQESQQSQQSGEMMNDKIRELLYEPREDTHREKIFIPDVINLTPDVEPRPMLLPKEEREELREEIQDDFRRFLTRIDNSEQQTPVSPPRQDHEVVYHNYQSRTESPTVPQPTGTGFRQRLDEWNTRNPDFITVTEGELEDNSRRTSTVSQGATPKTIFKNTLTRVKNALSPDKVAVRQLLRKPTGPSRVPSASTSTRSTRASAPGLVVDLTIPKYPLESKRGRGRSARP